MGNPHVAEEVIGHALSPRPRHSPSPALPIRSDSLQPRTPDHAPTQAGTPVPLPGPLSADHLRTLTEARTRSRKVRRAADVATLSGWTMALFAGLTLLGALFGSLLSLAAGLGLAGVAYNELRGAAMLRRLDQRGARTLGYNQIALAVLIVGYAALSLVLQLRSSPLEAMGGSSGDAQVDAMVTSITSSVTYALYGGMAALGVIAPGLTAWYYFTRARVVREFLKHTPEWVVTTMRAAA